MTFASQNEEQLTAALRRQFGDIEPEDRAWLLALMDRFPIPRVDCAPELVSAIARIAGSVSWWGELEDGDYLQATALRLIERASARSGQVLAPRRPADIDEDYGGDRLLTRSLMVTATEVGTPAAEALRAVLLACHWRWQGSANPHSTAISDLGSAIRGLSANKLDARLLRDLGRAKSFESFLSAASRIKDSKHAALAAAWRTVFEPNLPALASAQAPVPATEPFATVAPTPAGAPDTTSIPAGSSEDLPDPPQPSPAGEAPTPPPGPTGAPGRPSPRAKTRFGTPVSAEDALVDKLQGAIRRGQGPRPPHVPAPMPAEPPEEVIPPVLTSSMPQAPAHEDAKAILRYQVRQAVWSSNYLLLPNHPDVLPLGHYRQAMAGLLDLLREGGLEPTLGQGAVGLLVQALTGRVPRSLKALAVLKSADEPHDPDRLDLLLREGALRLSCFWQVAGPGGEPSYFRPDGVQAERLEDVRRDFVLLLVPAISEALRSHADALRALSALPEVEIVSRLGTAARELSERVGLELTSGRLRSSFSTHLFELCRDTAATQLICADTLGQSVAPLSYYAPRARHLAAIHWDLQNQILRSSAPLPAYPLADERVGSQLLVARPHARAMARAPSRILHYGLDRLIAEGRWVELQNAMVTHLAGMLMAVATHRPVEALLRLSVRDLLFDEEGGAALFRDKVHDAAHDPRLVALPPTVSRQIRSYLEHLSGLGARLPSAKDTVRRILLGRSPLLAVLSEDGALSALDLKTLKSLMPEEWHLLPMNWGRHWTRTHAIELGLRPELVSMQLGHLEAAGYPFSGASPTEPWRFVEEIGPGWDELARLQGWHVIGGLPASSPIEGATLTKLRRWESTIRRYKALQLEESKKWRDAMVARLREYREQALKTVLENPELIESGIVARYQDRRNELQPHALTRTDFERIRDAAFESAGDDLALAIARANAVCKVVATVNRRTRQTSETPGKVFNLRRPLDNAFFPGMMTAVRQVRALRDHFAPLASEKPHERWKDMASACACTALAMVLFGYCDRPEQVRGAIERRQRLQRPVSLQDTILVPWGDSPHEVIALRNNAAIVLARLNWKRGKEAMPPWETIETRIYDFLPGWAIEPKDALSEKRGAGILQILCETAAVAHRYELSPAARRANDRHGGSTPAHIREQLAFLDGDPAGTIARDWEDMGTPPASEPASLAAGPRKGNARTQYLALCRLFPDASKDTLLPRMGETIPSGESASEDSRNKLIAEIEAQLKAIEPELRLQPIVRLLASWVLDLMVKGTPKKETPALVTVEGYLNRIGGPLVEIFGQSSLEDVDEAELEEAYLAVIESKRDSVKGLRQRTAAALLLFHAYAQASFGFPEIDLSAIRLFLGESPEALSDARLILPSERVGITRALESQLHNAEGTKHPDEVRTLRQALQVMPLYGVRGLRRNEPLGIQFRDVAESDSLIQVRIRPNNSRRLKTVRSRRIIVVPAEATSVGGLNLAQWVDAERQRLPNRSLETAYVFSPANAPHDATARRAIAEACLAAVREVTRRPNSRLHALRHLVAMESITGVSLTDSDREALSPNLDLAPVPTIRGLALPRDLVGQVVALGHANPLTTLTVYHHVGWLLRSHAEARLAAQYSNRLTLAPLLGVSIHTLDWALKSRPGRNRVHAWLDVAADVRQIPAEVSEKTSPVGIEIAPGADVNAVVWTARGLADLLDDVRRLGNLEKALLLRGGSVTTADLIRLHLQPLEGRLGRRILEERGRERTEGAPRRPVRRVANGKALEVLLEWFDGADTGRRAKILNLAELVFEYMQPRHGDRIHLPAHRADEFIGLIKKSGVDESRIELVKSAGSVAVVRLLEPVRKPAGDGGKSAKATPARTSQRYVGLTLKLILAIVSVANRLGEGADGVRGRHW